MSFSKKSMEGIKTTTQQLTPTFPHPQFKKLAFFSLLWWNYQSLRSILKEDSDASLQIHKAELIKTGQDLCKL